MAEEEKSDEDETMPAIQAEEEGELGSNEGSAEIIEETRAVPTKSSLNSIYGNRVGFFQSLSLLLNAALMVYAHVGLSAVIVSNQQRIEEEGTAVVSPPAGTNLTGSCTFDDLDIWNAGGRENKTSESNWCALKYQGSGCLLDKTCTVECFVNVWGYSAPCARCFADIPSCSLIDCGLICQQDGGSEECSVCTEPCNQVFDTCSGLTRPNVTYTSATDSSPTAAPTTPAILGASSLLSESPEEICERQQENVNAEEVDEFFVVYELMFFQAIKTAWTSDARLLAVIVVLFSGIWPYAKNIILALAWYLPLTVQQRDRVLTWLRRLGKYTLVDIYVVILLMIGVLLKITVAQDVPLIIKAEPRPAIVAFLVATVWEFVQIEVMASMHDKQCSDQDRKDKIQRTVPKWFRTRVHANSLSLRVSMWLLFAAACGLYVSGSVIEAIRFTSVLGGEVEGCPRTYNLYEIGTTLISDFFLLANDAEPAVWTLFFSYILFLIIFPLFGHLVHGLVFLFNIRERRMCTVADMCWTFASVEILALALFTVEYKFDDLIGALAGNEGAAFFGVISELSPGFFLLIAYSVVAGLLHHFFNMRILLDSDVVEK